MKIAYFKEYSLCLKRDMEFQVFGHGGKPCLVFPSQDGRFYDFEGFGMPEAAAEFIDSGRLQLFCCDGIDGETWSNKSAPPYDRIRRHEAWHDYIVEELVPRIRELNGTGQDLLVTGCSMGAFHAGNFFFRHPELFDAVIALSGAYHVGAMGWDYWDDLVYRNSPITYLSNMPADHPYIALYNQRRMVFCVGQGAWEDELLASTRELDRVLREKGIKAWVDYWGADVNHDWPWWRRQFPYFLDKVLGD